MSRDIFHIRDHFMRSFLSDPDMAKEFIRIFFPAEVTEILDFSTLKPGTGSFVSESLRATRADIVFECRTLKKYGGLLINLCFLIEHKGAPYRFTSVQTGGYIFDAFRQQIKEGKKTLTPVIPLVYYHGGKDWAPPPLSELFGTIPPSAEIYIPSFQLLFEDIGHYTDEEIWQMGSGLFASALMVQKYSDHPGELVKRFAEIFSILESWSDRNLLGSLIVYYAEMIESEKVDFEILIEQIPDKMKTEFISLADRFRSEGKAEGREEGREETLGTLIENMLSEGLPVEQVSKIAKVSREYVLEIMHGMDQRN